MFGQIIFRTNNVWTDNISTDNVAGKKQPTDNSQRKKYSHSHPESRNTTEPYTISVWKLRVFAHSWNRIIIGGGDMKPRPMAGGQEHCSRSLARLKPTTHPLHPPSHWETPSCRLFQLPKPDTIGQVLFLKLMF